MKKTILALALLMAFGSAALAQHHANLQQMWKNVSPQLRGEKWIEIYCPYTITVDSGADTYRFLYSYDEDYFLTTLETQEQNAANEWTTSMMDSYEYNFDGNVMEVLTTDVINNEDVALETRSYNDDMLSEVIYQEWDGDDWVNVSKEVYNFMDSSCTILEWTWTGSNWSPSYLYTYTTTESVVELLIQYMQGGAWQNEERQTSTLNDDGLVDEILYEEWNNNAWEKLYLMSYDYNSNGYYETVTMEKWDGGSWDDYLKYEYEYDSHGNAIAGLCYQRNGDDWEYGNGMFEIAYDGNFDVEIYTGWRFHAVYIDVTGVEEATDVVNFTFYPNPVKDVLVIRADDFQKAELYSLTGAKLTETTSRRIDVSALRSGIYMVKVQDMKGKVSTRAVVVE